MTRIKKGVYEHYKGGRYYVHGTITNATNNATQDVVHYESLSPDMGYFVRDISEFLQIVHSDDGEPNWVHHFSFDNAGCEKCVPRFRWIE